MQSQMPTIDSVWLCSAVPHGTTGSVRCGNQRVPESGNLGARPGALLPVRQHPHPDHQLPGPARQDRPGGRAQGRGAAGTGRLQSAGGQQETAEPRQIALPGQAEGDQPGHPVGEHPVSLAGGDAQPVAAPLGPGLRLHRAGEPAAPVPLGIARPAPAPASRPRPAAGQGTGESRASAPRVFWCGF
jgi:hypothetical protein